MYFLFVHKEGELKPGEIILKREQGMRDNDGGYTLSEVHCMHIWKCHNEAPCTTLIY
jgi:hypothetical protein